MNKALINQRAQVKFQCAVSGDTDNSDKVLSLKGL